MLEIWGRRNASNVIPVLWAVGELGLSHRRHDVGGSFGGVGSPEYLAMNPNGRIPTIDDDGFVLWESNAIVRFLCRRYGRGGLLPDSEAECAIEDQWMEWCKTTAYPQYIELFWAIVRTEPAHRDQGVITARHMALAEALTILEAHLAGGTYVAGERLTMADVPLGPMVHRYYGLDVPRPDLPNVDAWYRRLSQRPAFREHVMIPFGRNPAEWYTLEREAAV
jgi:glutathione S-transferase